MNMTLREELFEEKEGATKIGERLEEAVRNADYKKKGYLTIPMLHLML